MAAGDSFVSICNTGLYLIGADRINALTDNNKRAIFCNERFHPLRRKLLRLHDWNFARKRQALAAASTAPPFGWAQAYPLPADFLRLVGMDEDDEDDIDFEWVVENFAGVPAVLTNQASDTGGVLNLRYVYDCQDPTIFDPLFCEALGALIGLEAAQPLGRSLKERQVAQKAFDDALSDGRTTASQENSPQEWDDDVMLRSRS